MSWLVPLICKQNELGLVSLPQVSVYAPVFRDYARRKDRVERVAVEMYVYTCIFS